MSAIPRVAERNESEIPALADAAVLRALWDEGLASGAGRFATIDDIKSHARLLAEQDKPRDNT